jgi:heterotetrameric sarcosine oxidase gamma subunit
MAPATRTARTPLQHWHTAQGARFAESDGWQLPQVYSSVEAETAAARTGLALADLSAFAKISLQGRGVAALTRALIGDGPATRPLGVAALTADGPALACRLTEDHLLLLTEMTNPTALAERLASLGQGQPIIQSDVTSAYAGFCLVGPHTEMALRHVTALDVAPAALPVSSCAETSLAGVHALLVRAPEVTVPSLRIYVAWDLGEYVWERLLDAGRRLGIIPLGQEGLRVLAVVAPAR